jgi:predicted Zn-dependent protease
MPHKTQHLALLLFLFCYPFQISLAAKKSVDLKLTVAAKKWTGIRLRNLNKDTLISTDISMNGFADIFLLDNLSYKEFPNNRENALFHASANNKLNFSISIPKTDNYVLIVDNRKGTNELSFSLHINASLETQPQPIADKTQVSAKKINQQLSKLSSTLKKAFIFNDIDIEIKKCGKANAYSNQSTVFLCIELVQKLLQKSNDKKNIQNLLLFTLLHEMGHTLLRQWDYPLYDNEDAVDQFATVLLIMFNQPEAAKAQADFFSATPPKAEYNQKVKKDIQHSLSIQRARNIRRWLNDPEIVKKWQSFFIPKMQTPFLRKLQVQPQTWSNLELIKKELKTRTLTSME